MSQLMADFPSDRLEESAPFTNVGMDVFGPFNYSEGKNTRRRVSEKKLWVMPTFPQRASGAIASNGYSNVPKRPRALHFSKRTLCDHKK